MPRRFPRRTRADWAKIASHRIISVLRRHRLCNVRQLESKISEAGPTNVRAQPLSIKDGLAYLLERGAVKVALPRDSADGISIDFYALEDFTVDRYNDKGRLDFIKQYWPVYRQATSDKALCGEVLETLVDQALAQSPDFLRIGAPGKTFQNSWVDGRRFDNSPPVDHVVYYRDRSLVLGVEDKNWREWIYPNDDIIPKLLKKSLDNKHFPVLITRKLPYLTRLVFSRLGVLGFEMHFMYLHPSVEAKFELIRHKDGLGFADGRFSANPPKHLLQFLQSTLVNEIEASAKTFEANRALIEGFLAEQISYYEFMAALGIFPEIEEDPDYPEYYGDYYRD